MTCIAGIAEAGKVYLGGDTAAIDSWDRLINRAESKVFVKGAYAFGYTDSFRVGQLLQYAFEPPVWSSEGSLHGFLCTTFIDQWRACLKAAGAAKIENEVDSGVCFLVGVHGRLFKVEPDHQVGESVSGYDACGSGQQLALGSLFSTDDQSYPNLRIMTALKAAAAHCSTVRGPFNLVKV